VSRIVPEPTDAAGRDAGHVVRHAGGHLRHHVHRVGGDDEDRLGRGAQHLGHERPEHVGVAGEQVEARLAGALPHAGREHHDPRPLERGDLARAHTHRGRERRGVQHVLGVRPGEVGVEVGEDDLGGGAAEHHGERGGAADVAGAYDADLHALLRLGDWRLAAVNGVGAGAWSGGAWSGRSLTAPGVRRWR
jgi:hypothetical protein